MRNRNPEALGDWAHLGKTMCLHRPQNQERPEEVTCASRDQEAHLASGSPLGKGGVTGPWLQEEGKTYAASPAPPTLEPWP